MLPAMPLVNQQDSIEIEILNMLFRNALLGGNHFLKYISTKCSARMKQQNSLRHCRDRFIFLKKCFSATTFCL